MNNWRIVFAFVVGFMCANAFAGSQMYFVHNDHLNTPQVLTNSSQQVVWEVQSQSPFGEVVVDGDVDGDGEVVEFNLRFPGQYFDVETGTSYNYYRTYDPGLGRYVQSDPIGLNGGINTYGYAYQNPVKYTDPDGLNPLLVVGAVARACASNPACRTAAARGAGAASAAAVAYGANSYYQTVYSQPWATTSPYDIAYGSDIHIGPWPGSTTNPSPEQAGDEASEEILEEELCPPEGSDDPQHCKKMTRLCRSKCQARGSAGSGGRYSDWLGKCVLRCTQNLNCSNVGF